MSAPLPWGSDVPISMPGPLDRDATVLKVMGGFCFTAGGISHNFTHADLDVFLTPTFRPRVNPGGRDA